MHTPTPRLLLLAASTAVPFTLSACGRASLVPPTEVVRVALPAATTSWYEPSRDLGPLFHDVQVAGVFEDSKTFVDAKARAAPADIVRRYVAERGTPGFSLRGFVERNFELPQPVGGDVRSDTTRSMEQHITALWPVLTRSADSPDPRSSLIPLPNGYVVPGGRFREVYYWDSYFTMLGLAQGGRADLMRGMLDNFAHLVRTVGHIPNGNRTYYLGRSQPPYFAAMVGLYARTADTAQALRYLDALEAEHRFWMAGSERLAPGEAHRRAVRLPNGALLNRYWDDIPAPRPESYREDEALGRSLPTAERERLYRNLRAGAESGWDYSSRWMRDPRNLRSLEVIDVAPIDLNALLHESERTIAALRRARGTAADVSTAARFEALADARRRALVDAAWDPQSGFFYDVRWGSGQRVTDRPTLAAAAMLYFGLASDAQARSVAATLERDFLQPGGFTTTRIASGQQWDAPNGWPPLEWLTIEGVRRYGHARLADEARDRWLAVNRRVYQATGRMMEKYDVSDLSRRAGGGEYPTQDGFGWTNGVALALSAQPGQQAAQPSRPARDAQVPHATFQAAGMELRLEALDDDLIRFEVRAAGSEPRVPIGASMMVHKTDYAGARSFSATPSGIETADVTVRVAEGTLCFTVTDKARRAVLTTICPSDRDREARTLTLARGAMHHAYGLGEQFTALGDMNGDWTGRERTPGNEFGNRMVGYQGGAVGNAMFPIMYAIGDRGLNYALFLDNVYAQRWDFTGDPWRVRMRGGESRGYVMTGADLPDLRRDYMELTGAPPVPPRQAFGLWVSEFGFEHWYELETKLATLREHRFPVDGFVLDLQWFGGIITGSDRSPMGSLSWDLKRFPDPAGQIATLRAEHGVGVIPIEEPYVGRLIAEHDTLTRRGFLVRQRAGGPPVYLTENPWWGKGGMFDYTSEAAGAFLHDWKRQPLVDVGVTGHWTDLGEPELFDSTGWYHGFVAGKHAEADVHNLYNLAWSRSVFDGYLRHRVQRRPLILSRSGTSGSQRYGVAMWSGDIGANLPSLATHMNAQMHMSMSGVDYFGSDIGGFHRGSIQGDSLRETYTQWFASGALLDVPVRVHAENLCNCKETAPDRVGHRPSNLANLRLRYSLTPYYYSLAHRAHRHAEPVVAPLVHYYQGDSIVHEMGDEKLIGRDLLVAVVARLGQRTRDVYLPAGTWFDFRTHRRHTGGTWIRAVPLYADALFQLPLYARAGAILPRMHVDDRSMNVLGRRLDGSARDELIARVYPDARETTFTLYEDDGATIAYQGGAVATTPIVQRRTGDRITVTVAARAGSYAGAPATRDNVIELVPGGVTVRSVSVNGVALAKHASREALDAAGSGWHDDGNGLVVARSGTQPVSVAKVFDFR